MKKEILAVDIGNTSARFVLYSIKGRPKKEFRVSTAALESKAFSAIKKNIGRGSQPDVVVASVVPSASRILKKIVLRLPGLSFFLLGKDIAVPIINRYKKPKQVGIDRLLNAYAAYQLYCRELIIIDFGTAITFDLVSAKGEYLGGIIAPGIEISLEALFQKTALLPKIRLMHPARLIGRDTVESIRVGCTVGMGGLCDRIVQELQAKHLRHSLVLATGGYASFMKRYCRTISRIDDQLVLKGILGSYRNFLKK